MGPTSWRLRLASQGQPEPLASPHYCNSQMGLTEWLPLAREPHCQRSAGLVSERSGKVRLLALWGLLPLRLALLLVVVLAAHGMY